MKRYIKADVVDLSGEDYYTLLSMARDHGTTDRSLLRLTQQLDARILSAIVLNPSASDSTIIAALERIADVLSNFDSYENYIMSVLKTTKRLGVVEHFMHTSDWEHSLIRSSVAENWNMPKHIISTLAKDEDAYVRRLASIHPKLPMSDLEVLTQDSDRKVRDYANSAYKDRIRSKRS